MKERKNLLKRRNNVLVSSADRSCLPTKLKCNRGRPDSVSVNGQTQSNQTQTFFFHLVLLNPQE